MLDFSIFDNISFSLLLLICYYFYNYVCFSFFQICSFILTVDQVSCFSLSFSIIFQWNCCWCSAKSHQSSATPYNNLHIQSGGWEKIPIGPITVFPQIQPSCISNQVG